MNHPSRWLIAALFVVTSGSLRAEEAAFTPAFSPDNIDWTRTRQFVDGKPADPDAARVKKALGFHPAGSNWDELKWEIPAVTDGKEHTYEFLIVLKAPATVGTLCINAADSDDNRGSRDGGHVLYLKPGATLPATTADPAAWVKVSLEGPQPYLRYAVLPPATLTQAFLYRDARAAGVARLTYWHFNKSRLFNITPSGTGYAEGPTDANGLPQGGSWRTQRNNKPVSEKNPSSYLISFEKVQPIVGLFLYSNVSQYRILSYQGDPAIDPALAPASSWKPVAVNVEADHEHAFQFWAFRYRWLGCRGLKTRGLKIELTTVERGGQDVWIAGLGAFVDLQDAPAPTIATRDSRPPYRVNCTLPQAGDAAIVINSPTGQRIRNLVAQVPRTAGANEESWDLKDDQGRYVTPGKYQLSGICGPALDLIYQLTPYPNVQQLFPDRVPWMEGHDSPHGWLSDHTPNWAVAARGDCVYFGAPMAEAGVCFIECDLNGKKLWGKHDFDPWTGVNMMAADEQGVYVDRGGVVYAMDPATREIRKAFQYGTNPKRRGYTSAMAAYGGKVAFAFTGEPLLDDATVATEVDLANCLPKPPNDDLILLLRLAGTPPGRDVNPGEKKAQGNGKLDLESTLGPEPDQFAVIAFTSPVPLGSVVLPGLAGEAQVTLSVLKPDATYPPNPRKEADWIPFATAVKPGWNCLPAPPNALTRALRVKFSHNDLGEDPWYARLEGLKLLRRRFDSAFATAHVRVNSGAIDPAGVWDAKRTEAISKDKPGIYVMDWAQPQKLSGLAIKEIDGAVTEIDVWQGPVTAPPPLDGVAQSKKGQATGWRNVATYKQARRSAQYSGANNRFARYIDGYVDFDEEVETRAVRLRVTEQWLDNNTNGDNAACRKHDGRSEHGLHFTQSYAAALDTRLCAIDGVAPLHYLRGEAPLEAMAYERVEIYDAKKGTLLKELPVRLGWHGLCFSASGDLYGIAKDHLSIVRIDQETGAATPVITDARPHTMTVGPDNLIYVHSWADDGRLPISVYDLKGKQIRTIGKPGGFKPGPWDPERLGAVHRLCVDKSASLWIVENDNYPRRIVQFKTDGTFVKEILGNTFYGGGGGGTINRYDKSRAYYGRVEFAIDWEKHTSRIKGLIADQLENTDILAQRVKGNPATYLVTAPLSLDSRQGVGCVYLSDEKAGTVRLVAAMGDATSFQPLRTSEVISLLKGGVPRDYSFVWSDKNADGLVQANEVQFEKKPQGHGSGVGRFDEELGCVGDSVRYQVRQFLPDGTPIYDRKVIRGAPHLRLSNGQFFTLDGEPKQGEGSQDFVTSANGAKVWSYPASGGVSGLGIPNWNPGTVTNELGIIGHETAEPDGLGEFMVVHANTGQWKIWTADGLLAGQVLLHKTDPRAKFLGPVDAPPGTHLGQLTASQEHFHGFFTKSEADGKYYIIMGFTNMSIMEVAGLDRFKRFHADVEVRPEDIERAKAWEASRVGRTVSAKALVVPAPRLLHSPMLDAKIDPEDWPIESKLGGKLNVDFRMGYDAKNLYLCWSGHGLGTLKNTGSDFHRLFKTGACLDLMLSTDAKADANRVAPVAGDMRLLIAFVNDKPKIVLYQPVAVGSTATDQWDTSTAAGGKTHFDRVSSLASAQATLSFDPDTVVKAVIPLEAIGLQPRPGLVLKLDWGVLTTGDGTQVKQRQYWANEAATGTADEAVEARLEPHLWGHVRFDP